MAKEARYANGGKKTTAKRWMQTEKAKRIRRNADNLRNELKRKGIKKPKGQPVEAGHNIDGNGTNGWESVAKNRAVETKNKKKLKRYTT